MTGGTPLHAVRVIGIRDGYEQAGDCGSKGGRRDPSGFG